MPNDALNYSFLAEELNSILSGSRIEKIFMPSGGEIILKCRGKSTRLLLCSAASSDSRVHLTTVQKENPMVAPAFLMHLRKHIGNGIILSVHAQPYERVIIIEILCKTEFTEAKKKLIVEITGTYSNIILLDENDVISEAIKHITPDISPKRLVLPGLKYTPIPPQDKLLPCDERLIGLIANFDGDCPDKYILSIMSGMAPVTITECVFRALGSIRKVGSLYEAQSIFNAINRIYEVKKPCLILSGGKYIDFCTSPFISVEGKIEPRETLNECMDAYYLGKNSGAAQNAKLKKLHSLLINAKKRTEKKLEEFISKKSECLNCEDDRKCGELITANIYRINKGDSLVTVDDYYTGKELKISLDINKSPSENAQAYFKKYTKKKNTLSNLEVQIADAQKQLLKYENALVSFELSKSNAEVEDIENELFQLKLLQNKEIKARKKTISEYLSVNIGGYHIDIGKNNIQNERLYKGADDKDIWLHVKDAHGSHVILRTNGKQPPDDVLTSAAQLAAYYSKSRQADKVAVDYTAAKNVKPLLGGGAGRVTYTNQKTLFVTPKSVIDFK